MKIFEIPKKNGKTRKIYSPSRGEKYELRGMLPDLIQANIVLDHANVQHAFLPCRSAVTNAECHIGFPFTVCFDLADFFDSISVGMFIKAIPTAFPICQKIQAVVSKAFVDGAPRQGLPTSPIIANITAVPMDEAILEYISTLATTSGTKDIIYTRYADDLTFSCWSREQAMNLINFIPLIVKNAGFRIRASKTRLLNAAGGRRVITGIGVSDTGIHPTRRTRKKLRTAKMKMRHAARTAKTIGDMNGRPVLAFSSNVDRKQFVSRMSSVNGLSEWSKLKKPNIGKKLKSQIRRLCRMAKEGSGPIEFFKAKSKIAYLEDSLGIIISDENREKINKQIEKAIHDQMFPEQAAESRSKARPENACEIAERIILEIAEEIGTTKKTDN